MSCEECTNCRYVGTGGHACLCDVPKMVINQREKTKDYFWCGGKKFNDKITF